MKNITLKASILAGLAAVVLAGTAAQAQTPVWTNPITDSNPSASNPFTAGQIVDANLTVSGIGRGSGLSANSGSNRYNATSWSLSGLASDDYFTFTLTPAEGYELDLTSFVYTGQRSNTGPQSFAFRSNLDGFSTDIGSPTATGTTIDLSGIDFQNLSEPITFRLYGWGGTAAAGTFSVNDFTFNGSVVPGGGGTGVPLTWTGPLGLGDGGEWSQTGGTNWEGGPWDSEKIAVFQGPLSGEITVSGLVTANKGIQVTENGYTFEGGEIKLTGSVEVASGKSTTINSVISGTSGLFKTGDGVLGLGGTNTFTGNVSVSGGVLEISSNANLGNANNDLVLNGTLRTLSDVTLGATRDVSGSAILDVADATTLAVNGGFNTSSLTIVNTGTVLLNGATRNVGLLTFNAAATLGGSGAITGTGLNATNLIGTARVLTDLNLGASTFEVNIGADGILALDGDILTSVGFNKTGLGVLELNGNNSAMFRVRIGAAGVDGGTVRIGSNTALGANQTFFNSGRLEASVDLTGANAIATGISIGATAASPAVFAGSNITFNGASGLFETVGAFNQINVENTTTIAGAFTQGGTAGNGLIVGGSGTLVFKGANAAFTRATTVTNTATLVIDNSWGGAVTVEQDAVLKGVGTIGGLVTIGGVHAVGNSTGIQTVQSGVSYLSGATFEWELTANSASSPGVNFDQLVSQGGTINIETGVALNLDFGGSVDWDNAFWDADHTWTIVSNAGALSGMFEISAPSTWFDANGDLLSSVNPGSYFSVAASGSSIVLTYTAVVPEPGSVGLVLVGLAGVLMRRSRRS